jgi:alanine racemase
MEGRNGNTLINDAYNLDEKSLEIGLQFLTQNHYEEPRVLIISEVGINQNESVLNRLEDKLKFLGIEQIIYIGEIDQQENYPFITYFFKSGADYLLTPIEFQNTRILFTGNRLSKLEKIVSHYLAKKHITQLNIDLTKLRSNLNVYRSKISANTEVLAMVKAHSYGGGIVEVAKFLESEKIAYLGVAYADEGILLRNNGVQMKILVMNPEPGSFNDMIDYKLEPSIYSLENLDQFIHQLILKNEMNFPVHIKLETGMNRLGFVADEIESLIDLIKTQPEVYVKSVFSHLAVADEISKSEFTRLQINRFSELSKKLEIGLGYSFVRHIANSSAAINFPSAHFDMIRIGMGLFGLLDYEELQNVLTFTSEISQVKKIEKGDSVGYGQSYIAPSLQYIAIVPVGYADGLRRSLGNGNWEVIIKGEKYPIIGNVCMDMCMVNLGTDIFQVGDSVQVFGDGNTVQTMSKRLNTIPYEIISSISARVKRVYLQ